MYGHTQNLRKAGAGEDRIAAVGAWREAPFFTEFFTDAELSALLQEPAGTSW